LDSPVPVAAEIIGLLQGTIRSIPFIRFDSLTERLTVSKPANHKSSQVRQPAKVKYETDVDDVLPRPLDAVERSRPESDTLRRSGRRLRNLAGGGRRPACPGGTRKDPGHASTSSNRPRGSVLQGKSSVCDLDFGARKIPRRRGSLSHPGIETVAAI